MSEIKALEKLRTAARNMAKGRNLENHEECNLLLIIANAIQAEVDERFMELPVDADGVPIHVGDTIASDCEIPTEVTLIEMAMAKGEEPAWVLSWGDSMQYGDEDNDWGRFPDQPSSYRHVKPRTIEDVMAEYEELAANQNVKDYFEVSKELRTIQSEQFRDEPELELYKEVNGCRFYIELPYDELWIMADKVEVKHHSYSYRYERPNGNTVMSCSSLCGYQREWAIERLDEAIEEIRELLGVGE